MKDQQISVWSLIENNEFERACKKADEEYQETGRIFLLRNKIFALFHLKKYQEIISLSEKLIEYRNETSSEYEYLGIANWILGNTSKAIEVWQQAQNCLYRDAAGGMDIQLLLYFAALKTNQDKLKLTSVKTIKKLLKSKRAINYPGPLGHYLLDDITEQQLINYVTNVPILKERQLCQAHFVLAIKILERGDEKAYYNKLEECVNYGSASFLEGTYYLAKGELENKPESNNSFVRLFNRLIAKNK